MAIVIKDVIPEEMRQIVKKRNNAKAYATMNYELYLNLSVFPVKSDFSHEMLLGFFLLYKCRHVFSQQLFFTLHYC